LLASYAAHGQSQTHKSCAETALYSAGLIPKQRHLCGLSRHK
jgi:hypothetical protein